MRILLVATLALLASAPALAPPAAACRVGGPDAEAAGFSVHEAGCVRYCVTTPLTAPECAGFTGL